MTQKSKISNSYLTPTLSLPKINLIYKPTKTKKTMTNFQDSCGTTMPPQMPNELTALIGLKYIIFDGENGNFCKTDEYINKFRLAS